jgi:hypothetical protein
VDVRLFFSSVGTYRFRNVNLVLSIPMHKHTVQKRQSLVPISNNKTSHYEKKASIVIVNNLININKIKTYHSSQTIEYTQHNDISVRKGRSWFGTYTKRWRD